MRRARTLLFAGVAALVLTVSGLAVAAATHGPTSAWSSSGSGPSYNVTFSESGLPAGTHWSVAVQGAWMDDWESEWGWHFGGVHSSTTSTINFSLPNGSYFYRVLPVFGFVVTGGRGMFAVNGSAPEAIDVHFTARPTYAVTFQETGLASGTNWSVTIARGEFDEFGGGLRLHENTTGSTLTFQLPNGTYLYHVARVAGHSLNRSFGIVTVAGAAPATISVSFTLLVPYAVAFNESGLPAETNWTVRIFGLEMGGDDFSHTTMTSSSSTITFDLTNGTYLYVIERVPGFEITSGMPFGVIDVRGAAPAETSVVFSAES